MKLPSSQLYLIYSMSNSPYQRWQADLLDFSVRHSGQPGEIVRLVSRDTASGDARVNPSATGFTLVTPDYSALGNGILSRVVLSLKRWCKSKAHGRFHFYCLNRALAIDYFLQTHPELDDEALLLWLDPDMIFNHAWVPDSSMVQTGHVLGQFWWGYEPDWCQSHGGDNSHAFCPDPGAAIMFPFCITVADMRKIAKAYGSVSKAIYRRTLDWKSEMYGLVIAAGAAGLKCQTVQALGTCNNWPLEIANDANAPISHYTQAMLDQNGNEIWNKREYTQDTLGIPWQRPPQPECAASLTDQRTLRMIHQFIDRQTQNG